MIDDQGEDGVQTWPWQYSRLMSIRGKCSGTGEQVYSSDPYPGLIAQLGNIRRDFSGGFGGSTAITRLQLVYLGNLPNLSCLQDSSYFKRDY